jgi:hypothetical protein
MHFQIGTRFCFENKKSNPLNNREAGGQNKDFRRKIVMRANFVFALTNAGRAGSTFGKTNDGTGESEDGVFCCSKGGLRGIDEADDSAGGRRGDGSGADVRGAGAGWI